MRMEQLRSQMASLTQELVILKKKSSKIEEEIKSLQDKILEVGGDKLRAQKSKVDQIKEQIVITNERITKSQVAKSKAEKDITKFENSLSKNEKELEEWEDMIEKLAEEIQQYVEAARSIRAKADETKSVFIHINNFYVHSIINILTIFRYWKIKKVNWMKSRRSLMKRRR